MFRLVVITIRPFPRSCLITGFVTRVRGWGATSGTGTHNRYPAPELTPDFSGDRVPESL